MRKCFLKHYISLNKLLSICIGGKPFKVYEFDKALSRCSGIILSENLSCKDYETALSRGFNIKFSAFQWLSALKRSSSYWR